MAMITAKCSKCSKCKSVVSELGEYVKTSTGRAHLSCYMDGIVAQAKAEGRRELYEEQAAEVRAAEARAQAERDAQAKAQAKAQAARRVEEEVKAEALRILNAEKDRKIELTKKETEKLRASEEQAGKAVPRFEQIAEDLGLPIQPKCVRCGGKPIGGDIPNHCDKCWNSPPPDAVSQVPEVKVPIIPHNPRPIELE